MNKILGVYIIADGKFTNENAQLIIMGLSLNFADLFKGWDGRFSSAYEVHFEAFAYTEQALGAFIIQNGGQKLLTDKNTAIIYHDTSFPGKKVYCCILVKGKYKDFPGAGLLSQNSDAKKPSREIRKFMKAGEKAERKEKWKEAAAFYMHAANIDGSKQEIWRLAIGSLLKDDSSKLSAFRVFMDYCKRFGQPKMNGEDFALLAGSLYAYIEAGKESVLDAEMADLNITTVGYMLQAISDARYLGTDKPEFKQMEKDAEKSASRKGSGAFFKN